MGGTRTFVAYDRALSPPQKGGELEETVRHHGPLSIAHCLLHSSYRQTFVSWGNVFKFRSARIKLGTLAYHIFYANDAHKS